MTTDEPTTTTDPITYRGVFVPPCWADGLPERGPSEPSEYGLLGFIDGVDLALAAVMSLEESTTVRCPGRPELTSAGLLHIDHPWLRGTEILCCPGDPETDDDH